MNRIAVPIAFAASGFDVAAEDPQNEPNDQRGAQKNVHRIGPGALLAPSEADNEVGFQIALAQVQARLSDAARAAIRDYTPTQLSKNERKRVIPFVREVVAASEPLNVFTAQQYATALTGLVAWAHLSNGHPLSRGLLLSPTVVAMYRTHLEGSGASSGAVSNRRGYLRHMAESLGIIEADKPAAIVGGRPVAAPYSVEEEAQFRLWAQTDRADQVSQARALALVGLAAGAGVANSELALVRARDLIDEAGLWVAVRGTRARMAPVREEWADLLRRRAEQLASDDPLFPHAETTNPKFVEHWLSGLGARHRPVPGRLRATWIVASLRDGAEPEALFAWAGVARGESIAKYLKYTPEVASESLRRTYIGLRATVPERAGA